MRLAMAVRTAKDSSAVEGVRGIQKFTYVLKDGRIVRHGAKHLGKS